MRRLWYSYGKKWYDLGHIEAVDTDNAIFHIPRMFEIHPEDLLASWEALKAGDFAGRFFVLGVTDDGNEIVGEFWFKSATWFKEKDALWLKCEETKRKILDNFDLKAYLEEFPFA